MWHTKWSQSTQQSYEVGVSIHSRQFRNMLLNLNISKCTIFIIIYFYHFFSLNCYILHCFYILMYIIVPPITTVLLHWLSSIANVTLPKSVLMWTVIILKVNSSTFWGCTPICIFESQLRGLIPLLSTICLLIIKLQPAGRWLSNQETLQHTFWFLYRLNKRDILCSLVSFRSW